MTQHIDALHHFFAAHSRVRAELLADSLRYQGASPVVRPIDGSDYYAVTVGQGPALMYARHARAFVPSATVRGWIAEREHVERVNEELSGFRSIAV